MRLLSLILGLYLFVLAVTPCNDQEECKYQGTAQSVFVSSDHSEHENEIEHCSPFCFCACCGQTYSNYSLHIPLNTFWSFVAEDNVVYPTPFILDVHLAIWQPPKIS